MTAVPHRRAGVYSELQIVEAAGAELVDHSRGRLLDLTSGFGVAALGYSCAPVAEAVHRQMRKCSHAIPSLIGYSGEEKAAELIINHIGINDAAALLTTSGAEAVEVARKVAYLATGKPDIVILAGAYHGQSLGVLSLTAHRGLRAPFEGILGRPALVLPTPVPTTVSNGTAPWTVDRSVGLLEQWIESLDQGNSLIGAVLIEPMQNLAGYRFFGSRFGASISAICQKRGILLIADEIFTGFGRTGTWTLSAAAGYTPDVICVGKALTGGVPGGACVAPRHLLELLFPKGKPALHAPTFYDSPVVSAAMQAAIKYLSDMNLIERASRIGNTVLNNLGNVLKANSLVVDIRGRGAALAVEFGDDPIRNRGGAAIVLDVVRSLLNRGVLALNSGFPKGNVLLICPPLIITDSQLEQGIERLKESITEATGNPV